MFQTLIIGFCENATTMLIVIRKIFEIYFLIEKVFFDCKFRFFIFFKLDLVLNTKFRVTNRAFFFSLFNLDSFCRKSSNENKKKISPASSLASFESDLIIYKRNNLLASFDEYTCVADRIDKGQRVRYSANYTETDALNRTEESIDLLNRNMAINLHSNLTQTNSFQFGTSFGFTNSAQSNGMKRKHLDSNNNLNYRQTFAANSSYDEEKFRHKRLLPMPPPPIDFVNYSTLEEAHLSTKMFQNEYLTNYSTSPSLTSSDSSSNSLSYLNLNQHEEIGPNQIINPPYIKFKKPPSYEESLKKNVTFLFVYLI